MAEPDKSIKVVDRRLFTMDGEVRADMKAELEAPEPPPAAPAEPAPAPEVEIKTNPAFLRLLDMLAQTASLYLEGVPDPATGRRHVDLVAARQIIDSLAALKDKTHGRLSFEETDSLDGLVGELQMLFTRLAASPKGRGPAPPPPSRRS